MKAPGANEHAAAAKKTFRLTPEQQRAVERRADYLLVSASAGTGKTRTLVERVLAAVRSGIPLEQLLVITFTQKAAQEVGERLYEAFRCDPELAPLRMLLPQCHVSTIHAFCARLLREEALTAGVDPAFRVLAAPFDQLVRNELLDELFHHWYLGCPPEAPDGAPEWTGAPLRHSREHKEFLRLVDLCRERDGQEQLRTEITALLTRARAHPDPDAFLAKLAEGLARETPPYVAPLAELLLADWIAGVSVYAQMIRIGARQRPDSKWQKQQDCLRALRAAPAPWGPAAEAAAAAAAQAVETSAWVAELAADLPRTFAQLRGHLRSAGLANESPWGLTLPRIPHKTKEIVGPWNDLAKALIGKRSPASPGICPFAWIPEDANEILNQYAEMQDTLRTLLTLVQRLGGAYDRYKSERGLLDFADLELQTRRLLRQASPALREKFAMVLVDEFQDVNQLQADIVRQLNPSAGRFLVGDVKQCIYQFRLSDPSIFRGLFEGATIETDLSTAAQSPAGRVRLYMSRNFRSRVPVLATVNAIFGTLLTPRMIGGRYANEALAFGATAGLDEAQCRHWIGERPDLARRASAGGRDGVGAPGWAPVELHLIDPIPGDLQLPEDRGVSIEAMLAARRIREMVDDGLPIYDDDLRDWRPVGYADIAVILRSPGPTGPTYARILREHGIPVSFAGRDFFRRQEVRDFRSLIRTLENAHDDVDLAAVLRMPGFDFSDDDLARLRLLWPRSLYLLAALRATAAGQPNAWSGAGARTAWLTEKAGQALVRKCHLFLAALTRWRLLVRCDDLATAVAIALEESGLLTAAAAAGARQANLQHLLGLSRRYSQEQDHTLAGLITHLESIELTGDLEAPGDDGDNQDAVRILSLHKSKGLEFPVVILSLLGRNLNTADTRDHVLTGEQWLGVDILDPSEYVKTPTVARRVLGRLRRDEISEEEIRVLYVALTRAEEKLILIGVLPKTWATLRAELETWSCAGPLPEALLYRVGYPLRWILGALRRAELLPAEITDRAARAGDMLEIHRHDPAALVAASPERRRAPTAPGRADPAAALAELPALSERLARRYAHPAAVRWRGKYWATEIKRLVDAALIEEERAGDADAPGAAPVDAQEQPTAGAILPTATALAEGTYLHAILEALEPQPLAAAVAGSDADRMRIAGELAGRLAARGIIPEEWATPENLQPIARFLATPIAAEMSAAGPGLEREVSFSLKLPAADLARIWPEAAELDAEEWILVQGQIDALWHRADGTCVVLDFKSDRVGSGRELQQRAAHYRPQIALYREAATRLWQASRVECLLYFLRPGQAAKID